MSSSTTTPSANENVEEVGKRYFLPRSYDEGRRMQNQHEWIKGCAGGLIKAPIDRTRSNLHVLDAATADGYWIHDVAREFPKDAEFVGFDSAPEEFPPIENPSTKFHVAKQNLIETFPAEWANKFDLVHQRFVIPLFKEAEVPNVLKNLTGCVKPGGWIQLVEMDFSAYVQAEKTTAINMLHTLTNSIVSDPKAATKLGRRLEEQGFVNVHSEGINLVAGNAPESSELGERGSRNMLAVLQYFMSVAKPEMFGMTQEEWASLPEKFTQDMKEHKMVLRVYYVWAQKPEQ
ncbi:hypothetical protein L228DRAFT_281054 [Xylona heveae TC161]|uniref:S-adenosyl-L-methionine-dependent methyltransferase n=1 Tax=Xylona heveae (strain CBS 132557 / TC161) TaxID=1328760 RepID=A0A165HU18_XYLHT|nr:hypothetical protein L228DRAFT_281054 [Xylona heveae TC161]KZF23928.1 hypothetical protein L228DRAFT_281054 [Xylona heveae TC161]